MFDFYVRISISDFFAVVKVFCQIRSKEFVKFFVLDNPPFPDYNTANHIGQFVTILSVNKTREFLVTCLYYMCVGGNGYIFTVNKPQVRILLEHMEPIVADFVASQIRETLFVV